MASDSNTDYYLMGENATSPPPRTWVENPAIERFRSITPMQQGIIDNGRTVALIRPNIPMVDLNPAANEFFALSPYTPFDFCFAERKHRLVRLCALPESLWQWAMVEVGYITRGRRQPQWYKDGRHKSAVAQLLAEQ